MLLIAIIMLVVAVGWTPPPNCYMSSRTPTNGEWQPGVVAAFGGPHPHSGCGARVKLINIATAGGGASSTSNPIVKLRTTVVRINTMPNSTMCTSEVCITNSTHKVDWTEITANTDIGWYLLKVEMYDYLIP